MKKLKIYDRSFKLKAVQLGYEIGKSKAAKELGILPSLMTQWRNEIDKFGTRSFCGRGYCKTAEIKRISDLKRKLKESELKIEIFRNGSKYVDQGKTMIFDFIEKNSDKYSLSQMSEVLSINKGTYLKWKRETISPSKRQIILLQEQITSIFFEYKEIYGSARIAAELQSRGFKIKQGQVANHMRELGLVSKVRRNYKIKTVSRYNSCVFPNILNQEFTVGEPSKIWVSGITRIQTMKGLLFLTIIMDLFDRKIIGWNLSNGLTVKETTIPAWEMAVQNRETKSGLIFHSDRGIQYANKMFNRKLDSYKYIIRSMSQQENHLENTVPKTFFTHLKSELVDLNMLLTKNQMEEKIFEYLENLH